MNIIRLLHAEWNLPNPVADNFKLKYTMQGIRRHIGDITVRKQPITPELLIIILERLDMSTSFDSSVWAVALTMFYGLLRRSNVLVSSDMAFDPHKHLRRRDITYHQWGIMVHIRWSKTNQYQSRTFDIPLPRLKQHRLCPVQAIFHAAKLSALANNDGPAFVYLKDGHTQVLTSNLFIGRIRQCLQAGGVDPSEIASHSFRRGCATFCYAIGLPPDAIKLLGDWRSNCYQNYLSNDTRARYNIIQSMQKVIQES